MALNRVPPSAYDNDDDSKPAAFKILFEENGSDLVRITETPTRMIIPLVRMVLINEATKPRRTESLISTFIRTLDERMISRDRKGRIEAVQLMQAAKQDEGVDDVPL